MHRKSDKNHPRGFWNTPPVSELVMRVATGEMALSEATPLIQHHADVLLSQGKKITERTVKWYVSKAKP